MITVLYVDDEEVLLELGKTFLEKTGEFTVDVATSAQDAMEKLKSCRYDGIVSDYQMPGMDGIVFLRQVRRQFGQIPFILFTGKSREEVVIEAINNGADFYLQKGGSPTAQFVELEHKIRIAVERNRGENELRAAYEQIAAAEEELRAQYDELKKSEDGLRAANEQIAAAEEELRGQLDEIIRAQGELKKNEENFQALVERAPDAIYISQGERFVYVNPAMVRLMGAASAGQLLGMRLYDRIHPDHQEAIRLRAQDVILGRKAAGLRETVYVRMDGTPVEVESAVAPFEYRGVFAGLAILRDITARKNAEREFLESEEKYRTLVEHSMDGVFIAQDGRLAFANRAFAAMTGYTEEEITGKPFTALIVPEDREMVSARHRSRLAGKTEPETYEFSLLQKDQQTRIRVKMSVGAGKYQGKPATIGTVHDVTDERKREDALRESEIRSRQIADATEEGLFMHRDGIIMEVNSSACSLWGYTREELIGKHVLDIAAPPSRERVKEMMRSGTEETYEAEGQRKDGSRFLGQLRSRNITYLNEVIRLTSVRDITGRRHVEEALQKSEELHRKMIAAMPDIIVRSDLDGTILFVNDKAALLAGEPDPAAITGRSMFSFFAPESLPRALQNSRLMFERPLGPVEYEFMIKDGTRIALEVNGDVLRTPDGTPYGLVFICRNIAERKKAERVLRESEENYRRIIENMQDVFYRLDREGTITMISPYGAKIVGYDSPDEMIGRLKASDFYADPHEQQAFMALLAREGSVSDFPMTLVDRHGNLHHATASSRMLYDASGASSGVEGILHDITGLRQAEDSLREANRKLHLLSDITRHDIKNKLTSLLGLLDLARNTNNDPRMPEYLDRLIMIAETINEQIEFTRDYQELGILEPRWSDVHEMVRAAASGVGLAKIRLFHDNDHIEIYADPLVEKVFYNLIENAVKYGETITRISISAGEVQEGCRIVVEDDGIGIPAGDKEKIFGRGFGANTGFGLFLTREILAITGITIRETGEPGKGARFEILVPKHAYRVRAPKKKAGRKKRPAS